MAFQLTDLLVLYRPGDTAHYHDTIANLSALLGGAPSDAAFSAAWDGDLAAATKNAIYDQFIVLDNKIDALGTTEHTAADIAARDALPNLVVGDKVFVTDATADGTVDAGWAIYRLNSTGPDVFQKVAEQESLDVAIPTTAANIANVPAGNLTSTNVQAALNELQTELDAATAASHAAVTLVGTPATNPLTLTGQVVGFDISQLTAAP